MKYIIIIFMFLNSCLAFTIENTENETVYFEIFNPSSSLKITNDKINPNSNYTNSTIKYEVLNLNIFFGAEIRSTKLYGFNNTQNCLIVAEKTTCKWWDFLCYETKPHLIVSNCGNPEQD